MQPDLALPAVWTDALAAISGESTMDASTQVLCSCALTFGVPLMLAGWELWRLSPVAWRPRPSQDLPLEPAPLPDAGASPRVHKPLPDCLIPRAIPTRVRELV